MDSNKDAVAKKDFTGADAQAWDPERQGDGALSLI